MKSRMAVLVGTLSLFGAAALLFRDSGLPAASAGDDLPLAVASAASSAVVGADAGFVGSTKCKKCHLAEHKSWEGTRHGKAFETLKPGNATEAKAKHKLDPQKDYTKDATCVGCHTVGMGKPGGYQMPADEEAAKKMKAFEGVGCENCHGAGGPYMDLHEEIMKSKRKYKQEEMIKGGIVKQEVAVCLQCHNEKSPTVDPAVPFDYEKMKAKGVHEHTPPKQRE